jgi:hypothetical protein
MNNAKGNIGRWITICSLKTKAKEDFYVVSIIISDELLMGLFRYPKFGILE